MAPVPRVSGGKNRDKISFSKSPSLPGRYLTDYEHHRFFAVPPTPSIQTARTGYLTIDGGPSSFGWNVTHEDGIVKYTHNDGPAGLVYEVWTAEGENWAEKIFGFAKALDIDGDDAIDYRIVKTDEVMPDAGVGTVLSGPQTNANGVRYDIEPIPEPASAGLLALGGLAMIVRKRRR